MIIKCTSIGNTIMFEEHVDSDSISVEDLIKVLSKHSEEILYTGETIEFEDD